MSAKCLHYRREVNRQTGLDWHDAWLRAWNDIATAHWADTAIERHQREAAIARTVITY